MWLMDVRAFSSLEPSLNISAAPLNRPINIELKWTQLTAIFYFDFQIRNLSKTKKWLIFLKNEERFNYIIKFFKEKGKKKDENLFSLKQN